MAIRQMKTKSGTHYKVVVKGIDGSWITETFERRKDAEKREAELFLQKKNGSCLSSHSDRMTMEDAFKLWLNEMPKGGVSDGWRDTQIQMFRDYVHPEFGDLKLQKVQPFHIGKVMSFCESLGRAAQTRLHVYGLLHKFFSDMIVHFRILTFNPVLPTLRPKVILQESNYLEIEDLRKLLDYVREKPFGLAIWLQAFIGRRIGEVQALRWEHFDLEKGMVSICSTFARKENAIRNYPKEKKPHTKPIPAELLTMLRKHAEAAGESGFVVKSERGCLLDYSNYLKTLKRYCREAGVKKIATHALRHSSSEVWRAFGASQDNVGTLYNHSSNRITRRYLHGEDRELKKVAGNIRLFGDQFLPEPQGELTKN